MELKVIEICCGGRLEQWKSRERAKDFYLEGAMNTEGSESERYMDIFRQLADGSFQCCDGSAIDFDFCKLAERYHRFPNGTSVRDLFDRVEYPV